MRLLVFLSLILLPFLSKSQCIGGSCEREGSVISANLIVDNSLRYFQPSGFAGIGVFAGIWAGSLGFVVGGIDSKQSDKNFARRDLVFGLMTRIHLLEDNVQVIPFLNVGTNNYQDAGVRVGYKIGTGTYLGAMTSVTMHYGLSLSVAVHK